MNIPAKLDLLNVDICVTFDRKRWLQWTVEEYVETEGDEEERGLYVGSIVEGGRIWGGLTYHHKKVMDIEP